jgi:hypothetical protein
MLLHALSTHAQFEEYFNYPDMNAAQRWRGTDTAWEIKDGQLKSHYGQINSSFYISTEGGLPTGNSWQWWMKLNFNTSSLNYVDVFLGAAKQVLSDSMQSGYFVRIGNTKDEVCLYRKDPGKTPVLLIDGRDGVTDHASTALNIKVTCTSDHTWTLLVDTTVEGAVIDDTYITGTYIGFVVKQSTISFAGKHFFDNVIVGIPTPDTISDNTDVVINEILYDPVAGIPEFIELYNRSEQVVSLSKLSIAKRKAGGDFTTPVALPAIQLPAKAYAAFTTDPVALCTHYNCVYPACIYKLSLPALTNNNGDVVILHKEDVIDELKYSDSMHFSLAKNTKGVSLERLDANAPTGQIFNWHSAAATVGYATPGYANSQQSGEVALSGKLTLTPIVFSPDNDGIDDVTLISYALPAPGYVADIIIYNATGKVIKTVCSNYLLATTGFFTWDGTDNLRVPAATGLYVVHAKLFNAQKDIQYWKLPLVLAKRKIT